MADFDAQDQIFPYFQLAEFATWNHVELNAQDYIFNYFQVAESAIYNPPTFLAYETMSQLFSAVTPPAPAITTYYAMRAIDPDCPTLTYVSWVVTGSPDATGAQYTGPRCGASLLTDITITAKWQE